MYALTGGFCTTIWVKVSTNGIYIWDQRIQQQAPHYDSHPLCPKRFILGYFEEIWLSGSMWFIANSNKITFYTKFDYSIINYFLTPWLSKDLDKAKVLRLKAPCIHFLITLNESTSAVICIVAAFERNTIFTLRGPAFCCPTMFILWRSNFLTS